MRKYASHFLLDGQYEKLLRSYGVKVEEALRKACLPEDIFRGKVPQMTAKQYFDFMKAVWELAGSPELPVLIGTSAEMEHFSPFVFAAYCGKDGRTCVERMSQYRKLAGPLDYLLTDNGNEVTIEIDAGPDVKIPCFFAEAVFVVLLHIIRKATGETVRPIRIILNEAGNDVRPFEAYMGRAAEYGDRNAIVFAEQDLRLPFISRNNTMWEYFEPELKRRLYELSMDDSFAAKVRSALTELLPGGGSGADDVAEKLGVSRRTLQRKLREEDTTFREQLNHVRELLARHYLRNTDLPVANIAFLLGYQEVNSFQHSFRVWSGVTVGDYRKGSTDAKADSDSAQDAQT